MSNEIKVNLSVEDFEYISNFLKKRAKKGVYERFIKGNEEYKKSNVLRLEASKRANNKKIEEVKRKIDKAIKDLKLLKKDINNFSVSKKAGISYNTARKYSDYIKSKI